MPFSFVENYCREGLAIFNRGVAREMAASYDPKDLDKTLRDNTVLDSL